MNAPNLLDRSTLKALGLDAQLALAALGKERGLTVTYGGGSMKSAHEFVMRVRFEAARPANEVEAEGRAEFDRYCRLGILNPLKSEHFGKMVTVRNSSYVIIGVKPGRSKNVVKLRRVRDGATVFGSPTFVASGLR